MANEYSHRHPSKRVNLGEYETEEDILDAIEQSRRITRLIISAVQKGSKFEVSQILEHYGLPMTSRLHFKVTNIVMEQWFSLMGIEDADQIWNILQKNPYAMNKLRQIASGGTMVLSDMLTEWELGIGALQSKIIRKIADHCNQNINNNNDDKKDSNDNENNNSKSNQNGNNDIKGNDDKKEPEKGDNDKSNDNNNDTANGNADVDKKADQ